MVRMAVTIHELWSVGSVRSSEENELVSPHKHKKSLHSSHGLLGKGNFRGPLQRRNNCKTKAAPIYTDSENIVTKQLLWINGLHDPSWVNEELGLSVSTGKLFGKMEQGTHDKAADMDNSFVTLLRACAKRKDLHAGTLLHDDILKMGLLEKCSDALITMYAQCGALAKAKELLYTVKSRDIFSWTAIISGYTRQGKSREALNCFKQMQREGLSPDAVTFICVLKACGTLGAADMGEQIHEEIAKQGLLGSNIEIGNVLVNMYAKCGALTKAQRVLDGLSCRDVLSWNALISGYTQQGQGEKALKCFERMQHEGISPNAVTFVCILKACGTVGAVDKGGQIHDEISRQGLLGGSIVLGTALVDMYAKCGALEKAQQVLEMLPSRDVVSWNALITGYTQQGQGEQALKCFEQMQCEGLSPSAVTYIGMLKACGIVGAVDKGEQIHEDIISRGLLLEDDFVLGTALVDMYAKCGALAKAQQVLEELPSRNVVSWNALITGYAQQGQDVQALDCFKRMELEGFSPNAVTFSCVFNACSHLGLVEDCHMYFVNMSTKYGVKPDLEHLTCMVDLFGRAGHLEKAARVIQEMPSSECSEVVWRALLGACQKWGDVNVGRWAFEQVVQIDKGNDGAYVLMANIYAAVGMKEDAEFIEAIRMENKAWKKPHEMSQEQGCVQLILG